MKQEIALALCSGGWKGQGKVGVELDLNKNTPFRTKIHKKTTGESKKSESTIKKNDLRGDIRYGSGCSKSTVKQAGHKGEKSSVV